MAPTIHAVRHAQGYHNLNEKNHQIRDPLLTQLGIEQCETLRKNFPYMDSVDLVVVSPIKRTIYTALLGFEDVLNKKGLKVIGLPELQETSDLPCDTGSPPEEIAREFAGKPVDLGLVQPGWDSKKDRWAPEHGAIDRRARDARKWLMARPEKNIVVVTHGGFLHHFTEDWSDSGRYAGTGWANTEFRSYTFSSEQTEEAHLKETADSQSRRVGEKKPLDSNEMEQLKRTKSQEAADKAQGEAKKETQSDASHAQQVQAKA